MSVISEFNDRNIEFEAKIELAASIIKDDCIPGKFKYLLDWLTNSLLKVTDENKKALMYENEKVWILLNHLLSNIKVLKSKQPVLPIFINALNIVKSEGTFEIILHLLSSIDKELLRSSNHSYYISLMEIGMRKGHKLSKISLSILKDFVENLNNPKREFGFLMENLLPLLNIDDSDFEEFIESKIFGSEDNLKEISLMLENPNYNGSFKELTFGGVVGTKLFKMFVKNWTKNTNRGIDRWTIFRYFCQTDINCENIKILISAKGFGYQVRADEIYEEQSKKLAEIIPKENIELTSLLFQLDYEMALARFVPTNLKLFDAGWIASIEQRKFDQFVTFVNDEIDLDKLSESSLVLLRNVPSIDIQRFNEKQLATLVKWKPELVDLINPENCKDVKLIRWICERTSWCRHRKILEYFGSIVNQFEPCEDLEIVKTILSKYGLCENTRFNFVDLKSTKFWEQVEEFSATSLKDIVLVPEYFARYCNLTLPSLNSENLGLILKAIGKIGQRQEGISFLNFEQEILENQELSNLFELCVHKELLARKDYKLLDIFFPNSVCSIDLYLQFSNNEVLEKVIARSFSRVSIGILDKLKEWPSLLVKLSSKCELSFEQFEKIFAYLLVPYPKLAAKLVLNHDSYYDKLLVHVVAQSVLSNSQYTNNLVQFIRNLLSIETRSSFIYKIIQISLLMIQHANPNEELLHLSNYLILHKRHYHLLNEHISKIILIISNNISSLKMIPTLNSLISNYSHIVTNQFLPAIVKLICSIEIDTQSMALQYSKLINLIVEKISKKKSARFFILPILIHYIRLKTSFNNPNLKFIELSIYNLIDLFRDDNDYEIIQKFLFVPNDSHTSEKTVFKSLIENYQKHYKFHK